MKIGTICYATEQGIGVLPKQFFDTGVLTDVAVFWHSSRVNHLEWYPEERRFPRPIAQRPFDAEVKAWVRSMDAMLFFETPFDWGIVDFCREAGVRSYIMPMYECTPRIVPFQPHRWLCPSKLDCQYFPGSPFVPVPVPDEQIKRWKERSLCKRFLHNGGHLGLRGHKGTREILLAFQLLRTPLELTVRAQDERGLRKLLVETGTASPLTRSIKNWQTLNDAGALLKVEIGEVPRDQLFTDEFDAFVMAEKYNGLSLPLAEARAAGMAVVTSDRFPMNDWLPREHLIPVKEYHKACISGAYKEYDEAVVEPAAIAAKLDEMFLTDVGEQSRSGKAWAEAHSWSKLKPLWMEELSK